MTPIFNTKANTRVGTWKVRTLFQCGFVKNCRACFKPGANVTVDEQLFPTKARCKFTQYMANKPDKFGIKFWLAADVDTKYLLNGFPFLGKDDTRPAH